jgi:hypothetical protein
MKILVLALTLRQWSQSPFQKGHQEGCRFPGVSTEHLFSFRAADRTWKEEQSWARESIYLPSNASTQDMSWRWSRTCKTSSSLVRGCGLSKGDIVEVNLSLLSCKERIQGWTVTRGITSISETKTADTIPNDWPALKVGAPHCSG